jgi:hypothetical protein
MQKGNPGEGIWKAKEAVSGDSPADKVAEREKLSAQ